ncbi:uncharacterized protein SPPG_02249 [Spizellomyces punctatus DAOM BR117]|uniref:Uncharacterized protein n=1 Tax=Spizellomyces punctatus (strain DAOM BR117) TaxID=645134 RepID=A0A0L0HP60_SPIPD|nr:uncharacterized protein SPPG_02249 [Spizellomyces punctatus DAOM BR117]KND03191.1 hypothetical protein SPPG_02249 [Spizellomyces punctatus DAOM BR117]|eukprot:XP_016611230.1 hypothetical protein SPPG_02249 [Spizellomyces punctatus DAOM BR117]
MKMNKPNYLDDFQYGADDDDDEYDVGDLDIETLKALEQQELQYLSQLENSINSPLGPQKHPSFSEVHPINPAAQDVNAFENRNQSPLVPGNPFAKGPFDGPKSDALSISELQTTLQKLKEEKEILQMEKETLVHDKLIREGEISIVRKSLAKADIDARNLRSALADQAARAEQEKEAMKNQYQKDIERLNTEMLFLQQEIRGMQTPKRGPTVALSPAPVIDDHNVSGTVASSPSQVKVEPELAALDSQHVDEKTVPALIDQDLPKPTERYRLRIAEPPGAMFLRRLLVEDIFTDDGTTVWTPTGSLSEMAAFLPSYVSNQCFRGDMIATDADKSCATFVSTLTKDISRLVVDPSISLNTLLPCVDQFIEMCMRQGLFIPLPFLTRMWGLLIMYSRECRELVLKMDQDQPKTPILEHLQRLVDMIASNFQRPPQKQWGDSIIPAARHLFTAMTALAGTTEQAELHRLTKVISPAALLYLLDHRQPQEICFHAVEFCVSLLADQTFVDRILDQSLKAEGRRTILERFCTILTDKHTQTSAAPDQKLQLSDTKFPRWRLKVSIIRLFCTLAAKYPKSLPSLCTPMIMNRLIGYLQNEAQVLYSTGHQLQDTRTLFFKDLLKLLHTLLSHPHTVAIDPKASEGAQHILVATLADLLITAQDRIDMQDVADLTKEIMHCLILDPDAAMAELLPPGIE